MRLYLRLSPNKSLVPFDYQSMLVGTFHKWLGKNIEHDEISLYSLSWLTGGKQKDNGFLFAKGATWFISSHEIDITRRVMAGILKKPDTFHGMQVTDIKLQETPTFSEETKFYVQSPILAKKYDGKKIKHYIYSDIEVSEILTNTMKTKLKKAGIKPEILINFDVSYPKAKTKMVNFNGIKNRASLCPVLVKGTPEAIAFSWNVGIGHCTGSGFGAIGLHP